jgi:hypothetical protein
MYIYVDVYKKGLKNDVIEVKTLTQVYINDYHICKCLYLCSYFCMNVNMCVDVYICI